MQPMSNNLTAAPNSQPSIDGRPPIVKTLKLSRPLQTHRGLVEELEFREPLAGCFFDHDNPFDWVRRSDGTTVLEYHNKAVFHFIANMTGVDIVLLRGMSAKDFTQARDIVFETVIGLVGSENPTVQ